ncbi:MAG: hypothetical protein IIV61_02740, partial [Oscillospiraceae bacterium]|nr:hypothetical protein [Oscillospiraceae bacterium]
MPLTTLGTDFTTTAGSSANAYTWSADKAPTANYAVRMVAAERFVSPKHIHVSYPGAGTYAYQMLHSFTKVTSASTQTAEVAKESARYMVLVYRANGRDSDERIDLRLEH